MKTSVALLLAGLVLFSVSACSNHNYTEKPIELFQWSPDLVHVSCPSADCPPGVGVIIFIQHSGPSQRASRCTASMISDLKLLTNSHCDKELQADEALFFMNVEGTTKMYSVFSRPIYDTPLTPIKIEAGMAPDLALYELYEPISDVAPRTVARKIPKDMGALVGFMINEPGPSHFVNFQLQKEICTTTSHQPYYSGGVADKAVGLALYGCSVIPGNSGSPLFVPGDFSQIQVVVNSVLRFPAEQDPRIQFFGMGNRVHCMPIVGIQDAENLCTKASYNGPEKILTSESYAF